MNLIKLEFKKLQPTRYFKVLTTLWLLAFISLPLFYYSFLKIIEKHRMLNTGPLSPTNWPVFQFSDVWLNITYFYKFISIFLSFLIIITITREFRYGTVRQNIVDGMSRTQFWLSKFYLLLFFASIATLLIFFLGLFLGFKNSPNSNDIFLTIYFVPTYMLHLIHILSFAFFLSFLISSSGIVISLMIFWIYIIEPIIFAVLKHAFGYKSFVEYLPMESNWNLLKFPLEKYVFIGEKVSTTSLEYLIAISWILFFLFTSFYIFKKREL
ncbi:hypothetical protein JXR93_05175 [bacterium]|nr:hypothetical protein [bacterium]